MPDSPIRVGSDHSREYPDASRSASECATNLVRTAALLLTELDRYRRLVGDLNASTTQVLAIVEGAGEPLPPHVIAERLLVTSGTMTSLLDTLERRGLIRRIPHPSDRRKILIDLTPDGLAAIDATLPLIHGAFREIFASLSEGERETLIELLGKTQQQLYRLRDAPVAVGQERRNTPSRWAARRAE